MRWAGRLYPILGWTLTAAATYAAVFVVPYRFPLHTPVLSDTWTAGANNQVAAIALALVSIAVTTVLWTRSSSAARIEIDQPLSRWFLAAATPFAITWTTLLGSAVAHANVYWGDQGYFLQQLRAGILLHQPIYTGFEFAYGPALFALPAFLIRALAPFGVPLQTAYLVTLALLQSAGLALLFYVVQALPLRRSLKACAFLLVAVGTLNSLLGLNYSLFRFVSPLAAVVLVSRQSSIARAAIVAALAVATLLAVSPELGVAFAAGVCAYAGYQCLQHTRNWAIVALSTITGAALFALAIGRGYFSTPSAMAHGAYNLLITFAPNILLLLFVTAVLAPVAIARTLRQTEPAAPTTAMMLALYAASLAMLPAALGRCDAIHSFFDGIGLYLLAITALNTASARWRTASIAVVATLFVLTQVPNVELYRQRLRYLTAARTTSPPIDRLRAAIGTATITAPLFAPPQLIDQLTRTHQYLPGYFCNWVGVWDAASEQRLIRDMRRADLTLISLSAPVADDTAPNPTILRMMRLGLATHPPRRPYQRGALLQAELAQNWTPVETDGNYQLLRKLK